MNQDTIWLKILEKAKKVAENEPCLQNLVSPLLKASSLEQSLSTHLAYKFRNQAISQEKIKEIFINAFTENPRIGEYIRQDIIAIVKRDPACNNYLSPILFFKGFHALTSYRIAHSLWEQNRKTLALYLQSIIAETFSVDIHPAARIGCSIMFDHATGIVIGETAVIHDNVSILHEVTLGGTGGKRGDRHPKIHSGVLIGAGAKILGNVQIQEGAKIGAGSVVLEDVPPHVTVAGIPAKIVGKTNEPTPAFGMDHSLGTHNKS
jgi:serine O-acetyltransferase